MEHERLPETFRYLFQFNVAGIKAWPYSTKPQSFGVSPAYADDRVGFYNFGRPDYPEFRSEWVRCGDYCRIPLS